MTMTKTQTTEDAIRTAAAANGWTTKKDSFGEVTFTKGRRYVDVEFSARGTVLYVGCPRGSRTNDKAAFALAELSR